MKNALEFTKSIRSVAKGVQAGVFVKSKYLILIFEMNFDS